MVGNSSTCQIENLVSLAEQAAERAAEHAAAIAETAAEGACFAAKANPGYSAEEAGIEQEAAGTRAAALYVAGTGPYSSRVESFALQA